MDNGPEFISNSLNRWAYWNGVQLDFSRPAKLTDNAFIESFHGKLRGERLNQHRFLSLDDAQDVIEFWREEYHRNQPHTAHWETGRRSSSRIFHGRASPP